MGRPIKDSKMAGGANDFGGDLSGKLAVTAYRPYGGSLVNSTTAYIVNQRGSKKFKIHLEDSSEEVMLLKAVAPGSLANDDVNGMGQFCVQIILNDSTVAYVEKFYNNTVHWVDGAGNTGHAYYSLGVEGTDEGGGAGAASGIQSGSIDVR